MQRGILVFVATATAGLINSPAIAEWRCDCTTILDSCTADVLVEETFIEVSAPGAQCARVDYFVDGLPFVSLAVDGTAREDWITRSADPRVLVQSCQVCRDNSTTQSSTTQSSATADYGSQAEGQTPAELEPLIAPEPAYPRAAQARGIEGQVTVEFTVNPFGDTQDVRVASAEPAGVFDLAAVSAVSRWRYPADGERAPLSRRETLEFSIDDFIFADSPPAEAASLTNTGAVLPSNQCIRKDVTYSYGEMIEVGLINACSQPMTVFVCATGIGAVAERWVCSSTEDNGTVLVQPGDSRQGFSVALPTRLGTDSFEYVENFFVARAPNTEYWWIACGSDDERCREAGRQWEESLDRQGAHINPQLRTRVEAARSY